MKQSPTLLITRGCSPLGQALARAAAGHYRVAIASDDTRTGSALCRSLHEGGHEALFIETTTGNAQDIQRGINRVLRRWQQLDVIINLPGNLLVGPFEAIQEQQWQALASEQKMHVVHNCQSALTAMKKQGNGRIINVVPDCGLLAGPLTSASSSTYAGIVALTESLNSELANSPVNATLIALPLYRELSVQLDATDPLSQARFERKIRDSLDTALSLSADIMAMLDKPESATLHLPSAPTRAHWRLKRWFRKRWDNKMQQRGQRYRRREPEP
ncbi:SDR family NAD(P)-dependent oxidoreductase [Alcanivorax sp. DG881]|uniref:SDR family NAD(P)-dependent oxidoreductase n=1 Tax=Alcanivorax sp. DG881 TaxID=236097 RepID=UPI00017ED374|nr:SDR family NAD(P)-dependent oxidoreductase [Alcanivorax sp. DG881]EDX88399.1 oxidoreductase, short chain dehydrogenase/reductase family [Alcanivorax sp. DG881]